MGRRRGREGLMRTVSCGSSDRKGGRWELPETHDSQDTRRCGRIWPGKMISILRRVTRAGFDSGSAPSATVSRGSRDCLGGRGQNSRVSCH